MYLILVGDKLDAVPFVAVIQLRNASTTPNISIEKWPDSVIEISNNFL